MVSTAGWRVERSEPSWEKLVKKLQKNNCQRKLRFSCIVSSYVLSLSATLRLKGDKKVARVSENASRSETKTLGMLGKGDPVLGSSLPTLKQGLRS